MVRIQGRTSHLNYFEPYERAKGSHHENDLTRAFLALIDLVPMAMAEFLAQLRDLLPGAGYAGDALLPRLSQVSEPIDVATQKGAEAVDTEREWLVSVLMTDEHLPIEEGLQPRGKGAIYDGVITVGDHVVTLENKLHWEAVRMEQLNPDLPEERTIRWPDGARAVVIPWREVIGALVNLRDQGALDVRPCGARPVRAGVRSVGPAPPRPLARGSVGAGSTCRASWEGSADTSPMTGFRLRTSVAGR